MTGRPNQGKTIIDVPRHNSIGKLEAATGGKLGDKERVVHKIGVPIIGIRIGPHYVIAQLLQIKRGMDGFDLSGTGGPCLA